MFDVILKFDDMMYPFNPVWEKILTILEKRNLCGNFGVVTDWCENVFIDYEKVQLWLHGKDHYVDEKQQIYEFCGRDNQENNLKEAIVKFKTFSKDPIVFGPPGNRWEKSSILLMSLFEEIREICFCEERHVGFLKQASYTIERNFLPFWKPRLIVNGKRVGAERADWIVFNANCKKIKDIGVITFHPNSGPWDDITFCQFEDLLDFLKKNNITTKRFKDVKIRKAYC